MVPGWVKDLDDYLGWLDKLIDDSGGWLDSHILRAGDVYGFHGDEVVAVEIERQKIHFADGSRLEFDLVVNASLEADEYHFTYIGPDRKIRWRIDKHPGHDDLCHIHFGGTGARASRFEEVDLAEVLERVHEAMAGD